jgi:hypothetical protein
MWRDEPTDDPCDAPDDWEPLLPVLVGAPTADDLEFAELVVGLDEGPWHAADPAPCPVCLWPKPWGAESCGDHDCMIYAGAVALAKLDEPFGGELAAE